MALNKNKKSGFSLLELILAIAIFSIGSFAMATMLIDSNLSTKLGYEKVEALFYTREGIEALRAIRDNSWADLIDDPSQGIDNSGAVPVLTEAPDVIDDKYTRMVSISTNPASASMKDVSVTVSWDLTSAHSTSVTLSSVLTNWRL